MLVTYKDGTKKESITVSSNIKQFARYLHKYIILEEKYLRQKNDENVNKKMLNAVGRLGIALNSFDSIVIGGINDTQKKSVANFNDIMFILNKNTDNSFKSIAKSAKKKQKIYLNSKKSKVKLKSKNLKKISKDKKLKHKSCSVYYQREEIKFPGKIPQVIEAYINSTMKSINFHGVAHDTHKFDTASYPHI